MKNNLDELTREDRLLLLSARTELSEEIELEISSLLKQKVDWDYLIKRSKKHKLTPLLYWNLNILDLESVPHEVMGELRSFFDINARKNLLLSSELIKILNCFESNEVCAINFKGPSLALLAYNNLALREFIDIDIVVHRSDMVKVSRLMDQMGYVLESLPEKMDESIYFKTQTEHKFVGKKSGVVIEIHTRLQGHFFQFPTSPNFMYENDSLNRVKINNYEFKTFSDENLLLLLTIHGARHNWSRISWICDVSELIQHHDINWSEVVDNAKKLGVMRILLIKLSLVNDLFGVSIPKQFINLLDDDNVSKICLQIKERLFRENPDPLSILKRTSIDLKKRENLELRLMDVVNSIFKPTYEDFKEFPLPSGLFFLYYIIRPFLLIRRL